MPASPHEYLYVGIKRHVLALDASTGDVVWDAELGGVMSTTGVIAVHASGGRVYASSAGEIHCLDAHTGALVWHNELKGFGVGFASLTTQGGAGDGGAAAAAAYAAQQRNQAAG
jgi:outer membrane protein assembly factor BamB